jgi:perosamine synthetase
MGESASRSGRSGAINEAEERFRKCIKAVIMRIGRTLPPAAAPLGLGDIFSGLAALLQGNSATKRFNQSVCSFFGQRHCFLISSGKAALTLVLTALKKANPQRNRVLVPAFSCYSIPSAIRRAGLEISLCDIDPDTLDFDTAELQTRLADPCLLCIIPVHLFGVPADIGRLRAMLKDPQVVIIEDAAQAMGTLYQNAYLGTRGDVGIFSLGRGKALSTVEGGVVITNSNELAVQLQEEYSHYPEYSLLQKLKLLGYALALWLLGRPSFFWLPKALPFLRLGETIYDPGFPLRKLSNLQAGFAQNWQLRLQTSQQARRENTARWQQHLPNRALEKCNGTLPPLLRFPLRLKTAAAASELTALSEAEGLGLSFSYPDAICAIPELANQFAGQDYPAVREMARTIVTLPVHQYIREADRKKIIEQLRKYLDVMH